MATADEDLSRERFGFTIFLSVCFHAIVILGVSFTYLGKLNNNNALEVTFAQHHSILTPDDVRFVTRESQNGDRAIDEASVPSKPFKSDFNNNLIQKVLPVPGMVDIANEVEMQNIAIFSTSAGKDKTNQQLEVLEPKKQQPASEESTSKELSVVIRSLQEQLNIRRQAYDKRPRRYTISSASTKKSHDALYLDNWRRRIEAIGNINYPKEARREQIYGSLRLLVALLPNGEVKRIRVMKSSQHKVLDQAAIEIVELAAPFQPFPQAMRDEVDILEIIRTWHFHEGNALTSF
jgi:protein TonB|tara:strand:+ start:2639 stop:3514 length:876 start_codon:yes stop_codon:yes gene_type:complete